MIDNKGDIKDVSWTNFFSLIVEVQTMSLFSKWIELIITQDSGYFAKVTTLLKDNGIEYRDEIQNIGHANRRHGQFGALGENSGSSSLYQIYVKKTDYASAKTLLTQGK